MKVWNRRTENPPKEAVYVGRPTKWGNPFVIGPRYTRQEVIEMYREYGLDHGLNLQAEEELAGKDLVCWCAPEPCHADVLMKWANPASGVKGT